MNEQRFHLALETIWRVVGEANRYVDEQAPWALRRSDPARMQTVLFMLAETIRYLAILTQPFVPKASARLLDQLSVPARARDFAALRQTPLSPGARLPSPGGLSPLCRNPRGMSGEDIRGEGRAPMLVDSHCHLDFPDFAAERDAVIARARAAGIGTMLTIGTRLDEFAEYSRSPKPTPTSGARSAPIRTKQPITPICCPNVWRH